MPIVFRNLFLVLAMTVSSSSTAGPHKSFDKRATISHAQAKSIYNKFALEGHIGGNDASSNYGGPAVKALVSMAAFASDEDNELRQGMEQTQPLNVFDFGCGQGKLAEHIISTMPTGLTKRKIFWHGVDQSPEMITKFQQRMAIVKKNVKKDTLFNFSSYLMKESGDPQQLFDITPRKHYHRFVSTYCLDLLSETDIYSVLDLAEHCLHPTEGKLLLAGITFGYKDSIRTFCTTLLWEITYKLRPRIVGGCRPQILSQYLDERGWKIEKLERTMPVGFPWMSSEVICARPPPPT